MNAVFVAWRPEDASSGWRPVGRLVHEAGLYRFCYVQGARLADFQPFSGMEDIDQIYESELLFPLFANRLLPSSRPEYQEYLLWSGFDPGHPPDPIVVLGVTEGIRQTDAIEVFPCPTPNSEGCYLNKFFLHGIRWMPSVAIDRIASLSEGEPLKLMFDLQNASDPNAVALRTESERMIIGYVPRYLAYDVWNLVQNCEVDFIDISVARVNPNAPTQNRVLCRMNACWPQGFEPCSGNEFQPIPANFPVSCG